MTHTQTPWKVDKYGVITGGETFCTSIAECYVPPKSRNDNPMTIMSTIMEQQINAEYIVRAVNSHEELVEALKEIVEGRGAYNQDQLIHCSNTVEEMKEIAKAAITKAEGK